MNNKPNTILVHLLFWLYFIYSQNVSYNGAWNFSYSLFSITFLIVSVLSFYINYFIVLPLVFKKFSLFKLILSQFFSFIIFGVLRYFIEQKVTIWLFNEQNYYDGTSFLHIINDNFHYGFKVVFASICVFLIVLNFKTITKNNILENEKKNAEINALKSQINPHFLFNTLNNIYALIQFNTKDALKAVEQLGQMMRFTTCESQKEKITVKQEVEFMKSMIEIAKLSHSNEDFIKLIIDETILDWENEPYLLSPFLENALKHGEISSKDYMELELKEENTKMIFQVKNKISIKNKDQVQGIGLDNIKKKLEYLYPNKHQLKIESQNNIFYVKLIIDKNEKN